MKKKLWGGVAALILLVLAMAIAGCKHSSGSKTYSVTWAIEGIAEVDDEAGEAAVTVTDVFLNTDTGLPFKTDKNGVTKGFKPLSEVGFLIEVPDGYVIESVSCSPTKGATEPETLYDEDGEYKWAITENVTITATFAEPAGVRYTINWNVNGAGTATKADVFAAADGGALPEADIAPGTQVRFTVQEPGPDYLLQRVTAAGQEISPVDGVYTYTVNSAVTITAIFRFEDATSTYTVSWAVTGSDADAADVFALVDGGELPSAEVLTRTEIQFTVTRPDDVDDDWALRVSAGAAALAADAEGVYTHRVTGNVTITAAFTEPAAMSAITWAVDQDMFDPSVIFRSTNPANPLPDEIETGRDLMFMMNASQAGYTFLRVEADGVALTGPIYRVTVNGDITVTAYFAEGVLIERVIFWNVSGAGVGAAAAATVENTFTDVTSRGPADDMQPQGTEANPLQGQTRAYDGTSISFKVNTPDGYRLTDVVYGPGVATGTPIDKDAEGFYTYTVAATNQIRAAFAQIRSYALELNSDGEGHDGGGIYPEGSPVSIKAGAPKETGTKFQHWASTTAGINVETLLDDYEAAETSFIMPSQALTLNAVFGNIDYTLSFEVADEAVEAVGKELEEIISGYTFTVNSASAATAHYEQEVTVTVTFEKVPGKDLTPYWAKSFKVESDAPGYAAETFDINGFDFKMPAGNVTVTLTDIGMMDPDQGLVEVMVRFDADFGFEEAHEAMILSRAGEVHPAELAYTLLKFEEFDSVEWFIDGADVTGQATGGSLTVEAAGLSVADHTLAIVVKLKSNGQEYSHTVHFTVTR